MSLQILKNQNFHYKNDSHFQVGKHMKITGLQISKKKKRKQVKNKSFEVWKQIAFNIKLENKH